MTNANLLKSRFPRSPQVPLGRIAAQVAAGFPLRLPVDAVLGPVGITCLWLLITIVFIFHIYNFEGLNTVNWAHKMKRNSFFSISCEFYSKSCPSLDSRLIIYSFLISTSIFCMRVPLGKTRLHDFFQIYRPINDPWPRIWSLHCNYNEEISQKFDLVKTFHWRVLLT